MDTNALNERKVIALEKIAGTLDEIARMMAGEMRRLLTMAEASAKPLKGGAK